MSSSSSDAEFVKQYESLVHGTAHHVARELRAPRLYDDLVGYGYQGLLEARTKFDEDRGVPFHGFAHKRVRGAMIEGAERFGKLPRSIVARLLRDADVELQYVGEERARMTQEQREATVATGMDEIMARLVSGMMVARLVEEAVTPETQLAHEMELARVRRAMASLPKDEREMLEGFYLEERPLDELGAKVGLKRSGASRLHTRALALLRKALS